MTVCGPSRADVLAPLVYLAKTRMFLPDVNVMALTVALPLQIWTEVVPTGQPVVSCSEDATAAAALLQQQTWRTSASA